MKIAFYSILVIFACNSTSDQSDRGVIPLPALFDSTRSMPSVVQPDEKPDKIDKLLKLKWSSIIEGAREEYLSKKVSPLAENGILFPGLHSNFAFDASSGRRLYYTAEADRNIIKERISDSLLYFHNNEEVIVLNLFSGKTIHKYRQKVFVRFATQPILLKSDVFPVVEKNIVKLRSISDSNVIGSYQSRSSISGNFLWADDYIMFSNEEGIYYMNHYGSVIDSLMVGKVASPLVLSDGTIYCYTRGEGLLAIDASSRDIIWKVEVDWYGATITLADDTVFINYGSLTAFDRKSGKEIWSMVNDFSASQIVKCDNFLVGYVSGYSNIDIIGAADTSNGSLEMLGWNKTEAFYESSQGTDDIESDPNAAPVFNFSPYPYGGLIFGQYDNLICAFEIIKK